MQSREAARAERGCALLPLFRLGMCMAGAVMVCMALTAIGFGAPIDLAALSVPWPLWSRAEFVAETGQVPPNPARPALETIQQASGSALAASTPGPLRSALSPMPASGSAASEVLTPLMQEARRRRSARALAEPQAYARRIDGRLNQTRINFLVYGYGTTNEPPLPPQYKGSIAIYSLDVQTLQVSTVTLNHDIRAPEVERFLRAQGDDPPPTKIHWAYPSGGFDLMRLATEDATGLSVDFQVAFQDAVVKHIVDDVCGGLTVDVPFTFEAEAIYFEGDLYPARHYARGRQKLNGMAVLQFIKAVPPHGVPYDARKELAIRKQIVVRALLDTVKQQAASPLFWAKMLVFLKSTLERREIEYDFDAGSLLFNSLGSILSHASAGQTLRIELGKSLYVVDGGLGDGGVEWVRGSANPIMVDELKQGVYDADKYLSVPTGKADPHAPDLVADYWTSVRQLVRQKLVR